MTGGLPVAYKGPGPPPCEIVCRVFYLIGYDLTWTIACESSSCASMLASSA